MSESELLSINVRGGPLDGLYELDKQRPVRDEFAPRVVWGMMLLAIGREIGYRLEASWPTDDLLSSGCDHRRTYVYRLSERRNGDGTMTLVFDFVSCSQESAQS